MLLKHHDHCCSSPLYLDNLVMNHLCFFVKQHSITLNWSLLERQNFQFKYWARRNTHDRWAKYSTV